MTRAVLLTFLTLCSARVSLVKAGAPAPATCAAGQTTITKVENLGATQLRCPDQFQLAPAAGNDANQMRVYAAAAARDPVNIGTILPGATYLNPQNQPTVTVTQLPPKTTSVFFQCRQQQPPNNECFIQIEVAAAPRLGPNTCTALQSRIGFEVKAAGETAVFRCGNGLGVFPKGNKALDGTCSKEQPLPNGVTLAEKDGAFQLAFPNLPQNALEICYICTNGGVQAQAAERCEAHIAVAGSGSGGGGDSQGNGAATLGTAARSASALGLALVAAGFLHIC